MLRHAMERSKAVKQGIGRSLVWVQFATTDKVMSRSKSIYSLLFASEQDSKQPKSAVSESNADMKALTEAISTLSKDMVNGFRTLDNRMTGLEDKVGQMDKRITGMDERITGMDKRITAVEGCLSKFQGDVGRDLGDIFEFMNRSSLLTEFGESYATREVVTCISQLKYLALGDLRNVAHKVACSLSSTKSTISFLTQLQEFLNSLEGKVASEEGDAMVESAIQQCQHLEQMVKQRDGAPILVLYADNEIIQGVFNLCHDVDTLKKEHSVKLYTDMSDYIVCMVKLCRYFQEGKRTEKSDRNVLADSPVTWSVLTSLYNEGRHQWQIEWDHRGLVLQDGGSLYVLHGESKKRGGDGKGRQQMLFRSQLLHYVAKTLYPDDEVYVIGMTHLAKPESTFGSGVHAVQNIMLLSIGINDKHNSLLEFARSKVHGIKGLTPGVK